MQSEDNSRRVQHDDPENEAGCSQYHLRFDPRASTLDVPPPPWDVLRPRLSPCLPACFFGGSVLPSTCVHSFERPVVPALRCFRLHFSLNILILFGHHVLSPLENELISIYDLRLRFCVDMPGFWKAKKKSETLKCNMKGRLRFSHERQIPGWVSAAPSVEAPWGYHAASCP